MTDRTASTPDQPAEGAMTDTLLEQRLRSAMHARAADVAPSPDLRRRINTRIDGRGRQQRMAFAGVATAMAALIALALVARPWTPSDDVDIAVPPPTTPSAIDPPAPALPAPTVSPSEVSPPPRATDPSPTVSADGTAMPTPTPDPTQPPTPVEEEDPGTGDAHGVENPGTGGTSGEEDPGTGGTGGGAFAARVAVAFDGNQLAIRSVCRTAAGSLLISVGQEAAVEVDPAGTVVQIWGEGFTARSDSTTTREENGERHVEATFPPDNEYGLTSATLTVPTGDGPPPAEVRRGMADACAG